MFFPFRFIHAEKTLAASRLARHVSSHGQSVSVCSEAGSESRYPCVRKNHARARARTCFTVA